MSPTRRYHKGAKDPQEQGAVFVFGSNEAGIHGAGAAAYAYSHHNAAYGLGFGFSPFGFTARNVEWMPCSFAIPTKDWNIETLPLEHIRFYVGRFIDFAEANPQLTFFVTAVGCGLAGLKPSDMAPLFEDAPPNCILPEEFRPFLEKP